MNVKSITLIVAALGASLATASSLQAQQPASAQLSLADWMYDYDVYTYEWVTRYEVVIHWQDGSTTTLYFYSREVAEDYALYLYVSNIDVAYIDPIEKVTFRGNFKFFDRLPTYHEAELVVAFLSEMGQHAEIRTVRVNDPPSLAPSRLRAE